MKLHIEVKLYFHRGNNGFIVTDITPEWPAPAKMYTRENMSAADLLDVAWRINHTGKFTQYVYQDGQGNVSYIVFTRNTK
jgi:hypothetical protein